MKRSISILVAVVICILAFSPVTAQAQTYDMTQTDIHITVDDTMWYVFTRDNIKDNPELEELGITYEQIYDILYDNEAYMDAILYYEDGGYIELFVRKRALDSGVANLSNYKDKEVLKFAEELAKRFETETYSVYENQYKFAKIEHKDSEYDLYVCEYVTIVNRDNYTVSFQSPLAFTDWEYAQMQSIVDSITFDVDTSIKEEKDNIVVGGTIGGAVIGGIAGAVIAIVNKKKKQQQYKEAFPMDMTQTDIADTPDNPTE